MRPLEYGSEYIQGCIDQDIPLARQMGVVVESAGDDAITLIAPLAPNINHKGTAFGGSLYALAVLSGWAWITRFLVVHDITADAVIQDASIHYLAPVRGALRASCMAPTPAEAEKLRRMLDRAGRGRIELRVEIEHSGKLAAVFDGMFAATKRR